MPYTHQNQQRTIRESVQTLSLQIMHSYWIIWPNAMKRVHFWLSLYSTLSIWYRYMSSLLLFLFLLSSYQYYDVIVVFLFCEQSLSCGIKQIVVWQERCHDHTNKMETETEIKICRDGDNSNDQRPQQPKTATTETETKTTTK